MNVVLQMHSNFMTASERAKVDPAFRAENQAEALNSVGIGHYELRQFDQAEALLRSGIELLQENIGQDCRYVNGAYRQNLHDKITQILTFIPE